MEVSWPVAVVEKEKNRRVCELQPGAVQPAANRAHGNFQDGGDLVVMGRFAAKSARGTIQSRTLRGTIVP